MYCLGYLASSVTVVTSMLVHGRLLCEDEISRQGCSAAEKKKEGPGSCAKSTSFSKLKTTPLSQGSE